VAVTQLIPEGYVRKCPIIMAPQQMLESAEFYVDEDSSNPLGFLFRSIISRPLGSTSTNSLFFWWAARVSIPAP
jgi:hypothetical protein